MKNLKHILAAGVMMIFAFGANAQELAPDQNPNYMRSAEKYAQTSDEINATQGQTIQETYKAYDWREAKAEKQQLRQDRRYELRKLRYQTRNRCNRRYYGYNNGYYNNYYSPYNGYYNNNGYYGPNCGDVLMGAGLGLGLYYLLN